MTVREILEEMMDARCSLIVKPDPIKRVFLIRAEAPDRATMQLMAKTLELSLFDYSAMESETLLVVRFTRMVADCIKEVVDSVREDAAEVEDDE